MAIDDLNVTPGELPAIIEAANWVEHLPALVSQVIMEAGAAGDGALNFQARVLDARTRYLNAIKATDLITKDGKQMVRVFEPGTDNPVWKEVVIPPFNNYTVKQLATITELDLSPTLGAQAFSVNNSVIRTLTFKPGTVPAADRSMTVVLFVKGNAGINWPSTVDWNGGAYPSLGPTKTIVTLAWDGIDGRWMGNQGATI